ncbi:DUF3888 domain-containing protein [Heyndrickxia vini]|uniref:DUF3888 domain-containing protein n=1 Tax=Heyndrickxia vini TaxID=1476025 RepID=A0ABX7E3H8_9BACI|nr:DUF3888 domain-containing protein [Heyndrickxia vini]QQZ09845.1 DUF3888 domain-containing protein [Heyndrickxia vini]
MKKITILFACLLVFGNASIVMAEPANQGQQNKMTANFNKIFAEVVSPYMTEVVKKENGEKATWTLDKMQKLTINNNFSVKPPKRIYEVKMTIKVTDPAKNQPHIDTVLLKVDPQAEQGQAVELIEYIHSEK